MDGTLDRVLCGSVVSLPKGIEMLKQPARIEDEQFEQAEKVRGRRPPRGPLETMRIIIPRVVEVERDRLVVDRLGMKYNVATHEFVRTIEQCGAHWEQELKAACREYLK